MKTWTRSKATVALASGMVLAAACALGETIICQYVLSPGTSTVPCSDDGPCQNYNTKTPADQECAGPGMYECLPDGEVPATLDWWSAGSCVLNHCDGGFHSWSYGTTAKKKKLGQRCY